MLGGRRNLPGNHHAQRAFDLEQKSNAATTQSRPAPKKGREKEWPSDSIEAMLGGRRRPRTSDIRHLTPDVVLSDV
jgi:hypothetical protein